MGPTRRFLSQRNPGQDGFIIRISDSNDALQSIDAIERRGWFSAADKELLRVPSTISYTVSKLKDEPGVQLFERMKLTPAGQKLLRERRYLPKAARDLGRVPGVARCIGLGNRVCDRHGRNAFSGRATGRYCRVLPGG